MNKDLKAALLFTLFFMLFISSVALLSMGLFLIAIPTTVGTFLVTKQLIKK